MARLPHDCLLKGTSRGRVYSEDMPHHHFRHSQIDHFVMAITSADYPARREKKAGRIYASQSGNKAPFA
jgi:hypothetical protein